MIIIVIINFRPYTLVGLLIRIESVTFCVFLLKCHHHVYTSVHGFVNTSLMVDEGSQQQTIEIRRDIKGNPSAEPSSASRIDFTVICHDLTTGKLRM